MLFVKHILFLLFLTASKYFLVPPLPQSKPMSSSSLQPMLQQMLQSSYSPTSCSVTNYDLTFIYDNSEKSFKVHGLWPEQCSECLTCGYPSCCDVGNMSYVLPSDSEQITFLKTRWFNGTTQQDCFTKSIKKKSIDHRQSIGNNNLVSLFEHEFFKHASCTPLRQSASEFVERVMRLYDEYYETHVENQCAGYNQLWLNLDGNFVYTNITRCI